LLNFNFDFLFIEKENSNDGQASWSSMDEMQETDVTLIDMVKEDCKQDFVEGIDKFSFIQSQKLINTYRGE
jgi:hypothetical protein